MCHMASVSKHLLFEEVARVGVDRKSVYIQSAEVTSDGEATELDQRRRSPGDRVK